MIRVDGKERPWREGMTIAELLRELNNSHSYAVVRVNDKHISRPYFEKTQIPDHSEVFLISLIAGG